MRRPIALLSMALTAAWATASERLDKPYIATYSVTANGSPTAELTQRLLPAVGDNQRMEAETRATGGLYALLGVHVMETSEWTWRADQLLPRSYRYAQTGLRERQTSLDFDWQARTIKGQAKNRPVSLPLVDGVLDKLNYQIAVMRDLMAGLRTLDYDLIEFGKPKHYHLAATGVEPIRTGIGTLQAIRLESDPHRATLWCALTLHGLPVRMEFVEKDGSVTTAQLTGLNGLTPAEATVPAAAR